MDMVRIWRNLIPLIPNTALNHRNIARFHHEENKFKLDDLATSGGIYAELISNIKTVVFLLSSAQVTSKTLNMNATQEALKT